VVVVIIFFVRKIEADYVVAGVLALSGALGIFVGSINIDRQISHVIGYL
jgi:hypothetical protein